MRLRPTPTGTPPTFSPGRRAFVARCAVAGTAPWAAVSGWAAPARPDGQRLVVVLLRGGLDGLAAVQAPGDPAFAEARGALAVTASPVLALDGIFALHPSLAQFHAMYQGGEALVMHATGLPYRERSHFDAQQVLESGGSRPYELTTGWLARALGADQRRTMAMSTAVPLLLRGSGLTDTWAPSALPEPSQDLVTRLAQLYTRDPDLARALTRARGLREDPAMAGMGEPRSPAAGRQGVIDLFRKAAEFAAQPTGPQALVLEMGGWDTHAGQASLQGGLGGNLQVLDAGLQALKDGLQGGPLGADTWRRTAVLVVTEFGREVAINGTQGTDHGTGSAAFLLGGAVRGGRVIADWPGLAKAQRHEGRDLRITLDIRAAMKGLLVQQFGLTRQRLDNEVFPGSSAVAPMDLLRG
jgi:uncharacterized protein (DUF1501 family)